MAEPQQGTSLAFDGTTDMPLSSELNADHTAVRADVGGSQLLERITCSGGGTEGNFAGSTITDGSRYMVSEAPRPADSANMLSHGEEDSRIGVGEPAAIPEPGA